MNITGLTALLLDLAYQNSSKVSPASRAGAVAKLQDAGSAEGKFLDSKTAPITGKAADEPKEVSERPAQQPAFSPLPLRSDLFRESRFFARIEDGHEQASASSEKIRELFVCLHTENMGWIWVGLFWRNDFLSVKCFTESRLTSKTIKESFPVLREELKGTGFSEIALISQAKSQLGAMAEGLLPKFEMHLIDRKI